MGTQSNLFPSVQAQFQFLPARLLRPIFSSQGASRNLPIWKPVTSTFPFNYIPKPKTVPGKTTSQSHTKFSEKSIALSPLPYSLSQSPLTLFLHLAQKLNESPVASGGLKSVS
ncbi:hypothetical protein Drorol1_Dr00010529 [Drosera rotundifolia]